MLEVSGEPRSSSGEEGAQPEAGRRAGAKYTCPEMDLAEGIQHQVVFKTLTIRHLIDFSPETATLFRELRYCVVALAAAGTIVALARTLDGRARRQ